MKSRRSYRGIALLATIIVLLVWYGNVAYEDGAR